LKEICKFVEDVGWENLVESLVFSKSDKSIDLWLYGVPLWLERGLYRVWVRKVARNRIFHWHLVTIHKLFPWSANMFGVCRIFRLANWLMAGIIRKFGKVRFKSVQR